MEEKNFVGKVVLVTGSSRGIGNQIARSFADKGASVVINGRTNSEDLLNLENDLKQINCDYMSIIGDVSDKIFVCNAINKVIDKYTKIDILVNNAGIISDNLLLNMEFEDFKKVIDINLGGTFLFTKYTLPHMISSYYGKIINISSNSGVYGNIGQANYASSKAGLNMFTKTIAKEVGRYNININAIAPGFVETDIVNNVSKDILQNAKKRNASRRFAKPYEIANLVHFLASDLCCYINGETIVVDGGGYL